MSRNFGVHELPPRASNTVTISTTQAQMSQMRQLGVPMRPQAVPIRKINDTGPMSAQSPAYPSTSSAKEEDSDFAGQSSSTATVSSGPLNAAPNTANSFQQYQRGASIGAGPQGSSLHGGNGISVPDAHHPVPVNPASKVAEVFLTAGHAFQKLGDLTLQLHSCNDADESKWSEKEVERLRDSITKFAHELDQISSSVAARTKIHIKTDIKRRHLDESMPPAKRLTLGGGTTLLTGSLNPYSTGALNSAQPGVGPSSLATMPLAQKRVLGQPSAKIVGARPVSSRFLNPTSSVAPSSATPSVQMPHLQQQQQQQQTSNATSTLTTGLAASAAGRPVLRSSTVGRPPSAATTSAAAIRAFPQPPSSGALVLEPASEE